MVIDPTYKYLSNFLTLYIHTYILDREKVPETVFVAQYLNIKLNFKGM